MRLAQIVDQKGGKLPIPEAFGRMLGLYERSSKDSSLFRVHLRKSGQPIITTIPPRSWLTVLRISVLLDHKVGQLSGIVKILADLGINVLLMEGYGYHTDEEGWWSAVIDFPALHSKWPSEPAAQEAVVLATKGQLIEKVQELLDSLRQVKKNTKQCDFPIDEPADIGGFALVAEDGRFVVKIEPMKLRRLVPDIVEDLEAVQPHRVSRNAMYLPSSAGPMSRRTRKLMLCNTEERFIRLVDTEDLAEIRLEVHTEGENRARVGVGVLALVTQIVKDFQAKNAHGHPISNDKGVNVAFTYNYIMAEGIPSKMSHGPSENSVIRMFLESPPPISKLEEKEQLNIWQNLFGKLLKAQRSPEEEPFVEINGSEMIVWQRRKKVFRSDQNRKVQNVKLRSRLIGSFMSPESVTEAKAVAVSSIAVLLLSWVARYVDLLETAAKVFAGVVVYSLIRMVWDKARH